MYVSYSGWKLGDEEAGGCNFAYWNQYINRTQLPEPDDRLGSIYGSVVGKLFEDFYTLKLWKSKDPEQELLSRVDETIDDVIRRETSPYKDRPGGVLKWKGEGEGQNPKGMYANRDELAADVRDAIPRGLGIIRFYRFLGLRADAEFKLDFVTPEGHILAGRADFVIERVQPHNDLVILDGKGSRHRGKYVDQRQLLWYAMLYYLHSLKDGEPRIPDKLAFLFWRYPALDSLDWISVTESDVTELYDLAIGFINKVEELKKMLPEGIPPGGARGVFVPNPSDKNCRFCSYAHLCPPGLKIQERQRK